MNYTGKPGEDPSKRAVIGDQPFRLLRRAPTIDEQAARTAAEARERSLAVANSLRLQISQGGGGGGKALAQQLKEGKKGQTDSARNGGSMEERLAAYELERLQIFGEDYVPEQSDDDASCLGGGDDEAHSVKDGLGEGVEGASSEDQLSTTTSGDTDGDSDEDGSAGEGEKNTDKDDCDEQPPDGPSPTTN